MTSVSGLSRSRNAPRARFKPILLPRVKPTFSLCGNSVTPGCFSRSNSTLPSALPESTTMTSMLNSA